MITRKNNKLVHFQGTKAVHWIRLNWICKLNILGTYFSVWRGQKGYEICQRYLGKKTLTT